MGAGLTGSNMVIDWGDGTTEALASDTRLPIHTYSTNKTYTIQIKGNITSIGGSCFQNFSTISSVVIPNSVTSMKSECFSYCSRLSSVVIPNSVTSMGSRCFSNCKLLVDYQLYWDYPPDGVYWSNSKMPNNTNTYFTIPYGSTANYIAQNYPSTKLIERSA